MRLEWSRAEWSDRGELQLFECAYPPKVHHRRIPHPRKWQLTVQSHIRACASPLDPPLFVSIGRDEVGIGAYIEYESPDEDGIALIRFVARANRLANQGLGSLVVERAVREVAAYRDTQVVMANIHVRNFPSQRAFRAAGFQWVSTEEDLEVWAREVAPSTEEDAELYIEPVKRTNARHW